jgi:arabinose-5-phosphate isomerase
MEEKVIPFTIYKPVTAKGLNMHDDIASARRTIEKEASALRAMAKDLDGNLSKALDLMQNCQGRIIVSGMGKSGHVGRKMAATLASTGTPSFFIHPGEASHGDLGMITEKDIVLAISNGGESKELSDILLFCKRFNVPIIAMTRNPQSTLGKVGSVVLKLPDDGEACPLGLAPTSSTTATLVYGDVIAIALLERKGFSKTDYKIRHPGGKLGAILQKVSDLMVSGDAVPLVNEGTSMKDALMVMSEKRLGCVGIVDSSGNLQGIITDGDLRRHMSDNLFSRKADEIMTKGPKTTAPDVLAAEALNQMNEKKITQLFVLDDQKPVGVIHLHECLKAGVA